MAKENNKKKSWLTIWLIIILLVFITAVILIARLTNHAPKDSNTVPLVEEEINLIVKDDQKEWKKSTKIDIFKTTYTNDKNEVIVNSDNNDKVIAPGTSNEYTFNLKNTGNFNLEYELKLEPSLIINEQLTEFKEFPIKVRLKDAENKYLLGNEEKWESIENLNSITEKNNLEVNNYAYYILEWKWESEENNSTDTQMGLDTIEKTIELQIDIKTTASISSNKVIPNQKEIKNNDNEIKYIPWIITIIIVLLILITIYIIKRNKDRGEDNDKKNLPS